MAANFRIQQHRNSDNLHLNLVGDFDGTSAMELIHTLEENAGSIGKIFVHTCGLSKMAPFGKQLFQKRLAPGIGRNLVFTGKFGELMTPTEMFVYA